MMKKIELARKQAQRMKETQHANDEKFLKMMQFRLQQKEDLDDLKAKNRQAKSTRNIKY